MLDKLPRCFFTLSQYGKALYASFYSSVVYAQVVKYWRGLGLGYLLFLIMLGSIPLSWRVILEFNHFFKDEILFPIESLPLLPIKNGEIIYNHSMPHLIKNNKGEVVSIIDTTGSLSEMSRTYPQLRVLVTKSKIVFRFPSYKQFLGLARDTINDPIYTRSFEEGVNGLFSGREWIHSTGISKLNTLMKIIVFPSIALFYFFIFAVLLLLLSALAQLYSDIFFGLKLSFKASCRLLALASTPALVLFFLLRGVNFAVPGVGLIYGVLLLTYCSYGLYSVKRLRI